MKAVVSMCIYIDKDLCHLPNRHWAAEKLVGSLECCNDLTVSR